MIRSRVSYRSGGLDDMHIVLHPYGRNNTAQGVVFRTTLCTLYDISVVYRELCDIP